MIWLLIWSYDWFVFFDEKYSQLFFECDKYRPCPKMITHINSLLSKTRWINQFVLLYLPNTKKSLFRYLIKLCFFRIEKQSLSCLKIMECEQLPNRVLFMNRIQQISWCLIDTSISCSNYDFWPENMNTLNLVIKWSLFDWHCGVFF